jgi:hypothetical protein
MYLSFPESIDIVQNNSSGSFELAAFKGIVAGAPGAFQIWDKLQDIYEKSDKNSSMDRTCPP